MVNCINDKDVKLVLYADDTNISSIYMRALYEKLGKSDKK